MSLTQSEREYFESLPVEKWPEILYIGKEKTGMVSQREYKEVVGWPYSREYLNQCLNSGKIKSFQVGSYKFPLINI
jgi:hypothetical protein